MTFQTGMETGGESWLFWRESVWLPPNMTWADVAPVEGVARYTRFTDLFYPVPAALLVVLVRRIAERFCFLPLGKSLGLRATSNLPPPHNPTLERRFQENDVFRKRSITFIAVLAGVAEDAFAPYYTMLMSMLA